jgi:hypothetical protein
MNAYSYSILYPATSKKILSIRTCFWHIWLSTYSMTLIVPQSLICILLFNPYSMGKWMNFEFKRT